MRQRGSATKTMQQWLRLLGALCLVALSPMAWAEAGFSLVHTPGKLPKDVVPLAYTLHVVPDLTRFTFSGEETIDVEVRAATRRIVLNANHLDIDSATLTGPTRVALTLQPTLDTEQQTLGFALPRTVPPGRYTLALTYRGIINRTAQGLYYDRYQVGGEEKIMLGTNLEATDARSFFPSWDEPAFRARFQISVDVPGHFMALSNMPVQERTFLPTGLTRFRFTQSPKMSTYLVVLAAGEMERSSAMQDGVEIGVVTTAGKQASAAYALKASQQLVHYYNGYFGTRYPLPKLDQIAVPGGFGGAMENWGGVIYNETMMLYDPAKSPLATQQRAFSTLAHETAHQWFGNLVTMAWWDNLWLNESFASWMEAKATDHFNPQWHASLSANESRETAMYHDALKGSHPIYQPVVNESQAAEAFDRITYDKGQAFVRMLEAYLGEQAFRKGIQTYIAKHQYSNTTSADLWAELAKASGKPVAKIAADWTMQAGFPLIHVTARCNKGQREITLRQQQFLLDRDTVGDRLWSVPVQIGGHDGKPDYVLLQKRSQTVTRPGCTSPLVIDPQGVGYFRVQYAAPLLAALTRDIAGLPDDARVKVLTDVSVLFDESLLPAPVFFGFIKALQDEPREAVWKLIVDRLKGLDELARGDAVRPALRRLAIAAVQPQFKQLGWDRVEGESVDRARLRATLAQFLVQMGDEATLAEARARFARVLSEPQALSPDMLDVVIRAVGRHADQATFDRLLELARSVDGTEEKTRFYSAAFSVTDPRLAAQALPLALSHEVPPLIASSVLFRLAPEHLALVWNYARQNADALLAMQPDYSRNEFFPTLVQGSSDAAYADALEAFAKEHLSPDAETLVQRSAEGIRLRAQRKARMLAQLAQWLAP